MERNMASPIDPEMCLRTGRLLTEWFEFPHWEDEDLREAALKHHGMDPEDDVQGWPSDLPPEQEAQMRKINGWVAGRKRTRWPYNMTQQEVQMRLNEATKMIDPTNLKFLPDDVRERTGLEINPLWMMECLVRSGLLSPKDQVNALKELAHYTHSKAPSINHNTTTHLKPEDWLLELAKEEYQEIEVHQPRQPVEKGMGKHYESRMEKKVKEAAALANYSNAELEQLEALVDAEWEEVEPDE